MVVPSTPTTIMAAGPSRVMRGKTVRCATSAQGTLTAKSTPT